MSTYADPVGTTTNYSASPRLWPRISWASIFAGAAVALVLQMILNLLGLGIGAGTVNPTTEGTDAASGLGVGAIIWMTITAIVALMVGGWIAGKFAGIPRSLNSALHGAVMFALVTIVSFWMLTSAVGMIVSTTTNVLGTAMNATGNAVSGVAQAAANAAPSTNALQNVASTVNRNVDIEGQVRDWMRDQGIRATNPQAEERITRAAVQYGQSFITGDDQAQVRQRQELKQTVASNTTLSEQEIEQRVARLEQQARQSWQQVKQQANQAWEQTKETTAYATEATADAVSNVALGTSIALILGAVAAIVGAWLGTPEATAEANRRDDRR